ncbi:MAG: metallophosphoesterase [Clostridia bacterium]|nr:metallophosphoesterase [Clostridia bacterium]
MKIYAIADLHMDGGAGKPMDVFGANWAGHRGRIFGSWQKLVNEGDAVLIPGDISWAMHFCDALPDLNALSELPGVKVLLRGNHDYWWGSLSKMRAALPENVKLIQNDACDIGPAVIAGSRGWLLPTDPEFSTDDKKIYERELIRLELSLSAAKRAAGEKPIIAMLHFPPAMRDARPTGFTELLEKYGAARCLYGHLHGSLAWDVGFRGELNGIQYELCSADSLGFIPKLIEEFPDEEDASSDETEPCDMIIDERPV